MIEAKYGRQSSNAFLDKVDRVSKILCIGFALLIYIPWKLFTLQGSDLVSISMTSPGNSKFYDNWASGPVIIRSAKTNVTREEEIPEEDCRNWNCTCQGISNLYGIDHGRSFGNSPYFAKVFWRDKRCKTHPQYLPASEFSSGPPKVRAISNQHVIRQTRPQNADVNADTIDCSSWNCSCMGMSLRWHSNHFAKSYGLAPPIARDWWRRNRCHTTPIVKERPPHPKTEESKLAANSSVCYFFPTRLGTGRLEAIKQTWAKAVADRTYFIISENEDNETYVDWEKNEIHIAIRGYDVMLKMLLGYLSVTHEDRARDTYLH